MIESAIAVQAHQLKAAGGSDPGRVRGANEDRLYLDVERGIFLVADGVGGHAAGEVAARIAVDVVVQRLGRRAGTPDQRVREAIALANNEIFRQAKHTPQHAGMTCVLTLALLTERGLTIGHVGDSRLYKIAAHGITKVTHDHSPVGEREDARELSEVEAMRHPRRNEVFRDVGSAFHEPDDRDFIELIEIDFEPEAAVVLCSDGLSDMVPSATIASAVRRHAGDPAAVVKALIDAANNAGGKDNITVVYVEGASFPRASELSHETWSSATRARSSEAGDAVTGDPSPEQSGALGPVRNFLASRATWLGTGLLLGLTLAIGLSVIPPFDRFVTGPSVRTIVAGGTARGQFASIYAALANAAPGDVVQVEPGEYTEFVVLTHGVDLVARVPGTVALVAPSGYMDWVSIAVDGVGSRVSGIRVVGRPTSPIAVGIRIAGHDAIVDDISVEGDVGVGVDIVNDGAILVRSSRLVDVTGLPLRLGPLSRPLIRQNQFIRSATTDQARAIEIADNAMPQLVANVFVNYRNPVTGAAVPVDRFLRDNYVIRDTNHGRER